MLELYPLRTASTAGLRLGLRLSISGKVVQRALAAGGTLVSGQDPDSSSSVVLRDPDGHIIEIERAS